MRTHWKTWLPWAVSALAIFVAVRGVHPAELTAALSKAQLVWLVPATALLLVNLGVRAWRWSLIMGKTPFWVTFHAINIGYMLNTVMPLRLGEVGRAYVIGERTTVPMTRAFSSVIVERILDLASIVLIFSAITPFVEMPPLISHAATTGAVFVALLVVGLGVLTWQSARAEALLRRLMARAPRISPEARERWVLRFVELCAGFRAVGSASRVIGILALTTFIWINSVVIAFILMRALMPPHVAQAGLVVVASNLAGAIPAAPGGLGVIQAFSKSALVLPFHVEEGLALAFAILFTFTGQIFLVVMGLIGLARIRLRFSDVRGTGAPAAGRAS